MKLVIDRGLLLTGEALHRVLSSNSSLLHPGSGLKCCLGHYCTALGIADGDIREVSTPSRIEGEVDGSDVHADLRWLFEKPDGELLDLTGLPPAYHHKVEDGISSINDSETLTADEREQRIAATFKRLADVDVEFTGDYAAGVARAEECRKQFAALLVGGG